MSPEDIRKLVGGYAAGTLTPEEQQALFAAALDDQELFDELAHEQTLRDLLRDPAVKAELLSALDAPLRSGGFWQWLRQPMVAGLATAGVLTVAVVAVWQGTRPVAMKQAAQVAVAELRPDKEPSFQAPASPPAPAQSSEVRLRQKASAPPAAILADKAAAADNVARADKADKKVAAPPAEVDAVKEREVAKDKAVVATAAPPPPPPAPAASAPAVPARKAEASTQQTVEVTAMAGAIGGLPESVSLDARSIFYLNQPAPGANAFVAGSGGGGRAPSTQQAGQQADAPAATRSSNVSTASMLAKAAATRLGVRVSIMRGDQEVDLNTPLNPGETVRLKLIPNADGFLSVAEGTSSVASSAVQRLKPFETPELRFEGSGQRHLVVTLSRTPIAGAAVSLAALGTGNLVEQSADQGRATYVVTGAGSGQVVVPVTLTYR